MRAPFAALAHCGPIWLRHLKIAASCAFESSSKRTSYATRPASAGRTSSSQSAYCSFA